MLSDVSGAGGDFLADSRALEPLLPAGFAGHEIALDSVDLATARADLCERAHQRRRPGALHRPRRGRPALGQLAVDQRRRRQLWPMPAGRPSSRRSPATSASTPCRISTRSARSCCCTRPAAPPRFSRRPGSPTTTTASFLGDRLFRQLFAQPRVCVLGDAVKGRSPPAPPRAWGATCSTPTSCWATRRCSSWPTRSRPRRAAPKTAVTADPPHIEPPILSRVQDGSSTFRLRGGLSGASACARPPAEPAGKAVAYHQRSHSLRIS